jgi:hypothetical protein
LGFRDCYLPYETPNGPPCHSIADDPVITLNIPAAGSYVLLADLDFTNLADGFPGFNDRFVECRFNPGGPTYTIPGFELRVADQWGHLSIHDAATYGGPTTVGISCQWAEGWADNNSVKVYLSQAHVTAIQVSALTHE